MMYSKDFMRANKFSIHDGSLWLMNAPRRRPASALDTARVDGELGIRATYYFRMNGTVFRPEIMHEIEGMGHEVGYHYEVLGKANGDRERAIKISFLQGETFLN
jgi:hypothetical protein